MKRPAGATLITRGRTSAELGNDAIRYAREIAEAFGRELGRYRKEHGVSEEFMAKTLGISVKFYRKCEAGHGGNLPLDHALRYCNLFVKRQRYVVMARLFGEPPLTRKKRKSRASKPAARPRPRKRRA